MFCLSELVANEVSDSQQLVESAITNLLAVIFNIQEAAANLFDMMHAADATGAAIIGVAPVPGTGLGEAVNDRLRRAAAPRTL